MCIIQAGYFTVNGSSVSGINCTANSNNRINVECVASFSGAEVGQQYKAELKIKLPTGAEFSFYTPLRAVTQTETFTSEDFVTPIPAGTYNAVWFVVYNSAGSAICSSNGKGSGLCENLTITASSSVTINVYVQNNGGGAVEVYRNSAYVATVTTSQAISFNAGDTFKFTAKPSSNYSFQKFCTDSSCTQSTTSNPFTGTVQTSGNLYAFFVSTCTIGTTNFVLS